MRPFAIPLALAALLLATPAAAQIQPDVTMNPNATGTKVLLYPGGKYGRVQRPLLEPGEPDPNAPIVLHMPRKHAAAHRVAQAKPKPRPMPVETAAIAPPPRPTEEVVPLTELPKESAARLVMEEAAKPKPAKPPPAKLKPVVVAKQTPPPPRTAVAKTAPPPKAAPAQSDEPAMGFLSGDQASIAPPRVAGTEPSADVSQKSSVLFAPGAEEPPQSALDTVRGMAASLSSALFSGTAHIQLEAYGGAHGDKGSDARRLSLKRALIIRQLLIDDGIPSERIVVRAMGGAPSGALDRVDIYVAA